MKLEFKGLINKKDLEKDINKLEDIIKENNYAIVIDDGIGKYVVFDIDYVKGNLELIDTIEKKEEKTSSFTLVEAMIKILEEQKNYRSTAIKLSKQVEKYYGNTTKPTIIRARAEENANNKGDYNYFIIEPGNIIGLNDNVTYDLYMKNKARKAIDNYLDKLLKNQDFIPLYKTINDLSLMLNAPTFNNRFINYSIEMVQDLIISTNNYRVIEIENSKYIKKLY